MLIELPKTQESRLLELAAPGQPPRPRPTASHAATNSLSSSAARLAPMSRCVLATRSMISATCKSR